MHRQLSLFSTIAKKHAAELPARLYAAGAVLLFALFIIAPSQSATAAAVQGGLTISPTSVDKEIEPGGNYSGSITVLNQGQTDFGYTIYTSPYSVNGEDYNPDFTPIPGAPNITKWFTFSTPTNGELKTGTQTQVNYTVTVPQNTPAGSYYAVIFAETSGQASGGVVTRKRVGTIFYVRVAGQATLRGSIESWSVPWLEKYPITANLRMANTGTVNYQAQLNITVSDIFGGSKYNFARSPEILPQKIRLIPIPWQNGAKFGLFKVGGTVTYYGQTYKLPTKYVFVASKTMRFVTIGIFLAFAAAVILLGRARVVRK